MALLFGGFGGISNSESFYGLTMLGGRTELQRMVTDDALYGTKYNLWLLSVQLAALTAALAFDQCPAPFAGPHLADSRFAPR